MPPLTTIYDGGTRVIGDTTSPIIQQPLHPSTMNYIGAQSGAGYKMSLTEINAVNNLVVGMVATGLWDKMQVIYPCIGDATVGANAFKWNLKDTAAFNLTFAGSWTFASTGMQVAAANAANRAATGYTPSINQTLGDAHISIYIRNFYTAGTTGSIFGAYNQFGGGGTALGSSNGVAGSADAWCINSGGGSGRISLTSYSGGMLTASRLTSAGYAAQTLNGGVRSTTLLATSGTRVATEIYIGSINTTGTFIAVQPQEIAFASLGLGLTRNDVANLYALTQAFQTSLNRQV